MDKNIIGNDMEQGDDLDFGPLESDTMDHPEPASGGQRIRTKDWFLICPPKNWQDAEPIDLGELRLLELVAKRLDLVVTRDDKRRKIYLGTALGDSDTPESSDSEVTETSSPGSPATPTGGLRFGNGWTADIVSDAEAGYDYEAVDSLAAAPLIHAFPDHQVSKNFRLSEFRPGEHSYASDSVTAPVLIRIHPALVLALEDIREKGGGQTIHVTSGYRPPAYNRKVGGVGNSTHIDGLAADIYTDHLSTEALWDICDRVIGDRGGVGFYPTQGFVHVDIRGYGARW